MAARGFWSYVHKDDDTEHGRIVRLARDIVAQYELVSGEKIELWFDKDALKWGDKWRAKIEDSLASVIFFIPVLSPRYFQSVECRKELQFFASRAIALGVSELVMPLLYVDVPAIRDEQPADTLVELVRTFQWEDWRDLRFADTTSTEYRRNVARLAERILESNNQAQKADLTKAVENMKHAQVNDASESGLIDTMAKAEEEMPRWLQTMTEISTEINKIGPLMTGATEDIAKGQGQVKEFANRQAIARRLASKLQQVASRLVSLGNDFSSQLYAVDRAVRLVIDRAPTEIKQGSTTTGQVCEFFASIRNLSQVGQIGLSSLQGMVDSIDQMQNLSRDLRPPLKDLKQGLTLVLDGRSVMDDWVRLVDESEVVCDSRGGGVSDLSSPTDGGTIIVPN